MPSRPDLRPALIVFLCCAALGLGAVGLRARSRSNTARAHALTLASAECARLELQLSAALTAAETLGALARQSGGTLPNFQKLAGELLATRPGLASLELQPGGVVTDIVPRAGRQRALGFNVLTNPAQRAGANAALQSRAPTLSGPVTLAWGEPGLVARVPVFQRDRDGREVFWGFVAASMGLSETLARARLDGLAAQGYDYVLYAPAKATQPAVTLANHGIGSLRGVVEQPLRIGTLDLRLALKPHGGWTSTTRVLLESAGVLGLALLLCLLVSLLEGGREVEASLAEAGGRLADETARREQAEADGREAKETVGTAQAQSKQAQAELQETQSRLAELQAQLEAATRDAKETAAAAETKLKQGESLARELQTRLDTAVRESQQAAGPARTNFEQTQRELKQAQQAIRKLQADLESAIRSGKEAAAAAGARAEQDQATIASLQTRLEEASRSTKESARSNAARIVDAEGRYRDLEARLAAADQAEVRIAKLNAELEAVRAEAHARQEPPAPVAPEPTPAAPDPAPETPGAAQPDSPALPPTEAVAATTEPPPEREQAPAAKPPRRKRVRRDDQMDLFRAPPPAVQCSPTVALPDSAPGPVATVVADEPENASAGSLPDPAPADVPSQPLATSETTETSPAVAVEEPPPAAALVPDLPAIEGLAVGEGLAHAEGNPKHYLRALRHFAEQQAGVPEKIRDALVSGDSAGAERLVQALKNAAGEVGAVSVQVAAATLARGIGEQSDPGDIEFLWAGTEKALNELLAELKPLLKPKEDKPASTRALPPAPPLNPAQLRKAANQILPLLTDQDPGAKDCLKDNRTTFRSAFTPEGFVEFEQAVKSGELSAALESLRKAVRKHGITV